MSSVVCAHVCAVGGVPGYVCYSVVCVCRDPPVLAGNTWALVFFLRVHLGAGCTLSHSWTEPLGAPAPCPGFLGPPVTFAPGPEVTAAARLAYSPLGRLLSRVHVHPEEVLSPPPAWQGSEGTESRGVLRNQHSCLTKQSPWLRGPHGFPASTGWGS